MNALDAAGWPLALYFLGLILGAAGTWWSMREPKPPGKPFDWAKECPELAPDGDHHHVRVVDDRYRLSGSGFVEIIQVP